MECLFCRTALSPLRSLTNGGFCSDDHALLYSAGGESPEPYWLLKPPEPASGIGPLLRTPVCVELNSTLQVPGLPCRLLEWSFSEPLERAVPLDLSPNPSPPKESACLAVARPQGFVVQLPLVALRGDLPASLKRKSRLAIGFQRLPVFKVLGLAAAVALVAFSVARIPSLIRGRHLSFGRSVASGISPAPGNRVARNVGPQAPSRSAAIFSNAVRQVRGTIGHRAAVDLTDDFRSGLGDWRTKAGPQSAWTFNQVGFVEPGALALYKPTMDLSDYNVDFVTQVAERQLGVAYRVKDWDHYYGLKLLIEDTGPHPRIDLARYTVVNGKETDRIVHSVIAPVRNLSLYHIRLKLNDSNFTLIAEGHIVDYWSDRRYAKGGFGFFSGKGERARVISVEVSHQHDWLGRFCALITPYQD